MHRRSGERRRISAFSRPILYEGISGLLQDFSNLSRLAETAQSRNCLWRLARITTWCKQRMPSPITKWVLLRRLRRARSRVETVNGLTARRPRTMSTRALEISRLAFARRPTYLCAMLLSVLDLSPVASGSSGAAALNNTLDLARHADALGYTRYWVAEHHNLPSIASSSPEIMIGQVASVTRRLRVGAGGVMLPNHA